VLPEHLIEREPALARSTGRATRIEPEFQSRGMDVKYCPRPNQGKNWYHQTLWVIPNCSAALHAGWGRHARATAKMSEI